MTQLSSDPDPSTADQQHIYTILLATARPSNPPLLEDLEKYQLNPLFIGESTLFSASNKNNDQHAWSHALVIPDAEPALPQASRLKYRRAFTVQSKTAFVSIHAKTKQTTETSSTPDEGAARDRKDGKARRKKKQQKRKEAQSAVSKPRIYAINTTTLGQDVDGAHTSFDRLLEAAVSNQDFALRVHLSGKIQEIPKGKKSRTKKKVETTPQTTDEVPETNIFTLMSFPDEETYAAFCSWVVGETDKASNKKGRQDGFEFGEGTAMKRRIVKNYTAPAVVPKWSTASYRAPRGGNAPSYSHVSHPWVNGIPDIW